MNKPLFEVKAVDKKVYEEELKEFLPAKIIDVHTHVWLAHFLTRPKDELERLVKWPSMVAKDNSFEDLIETYNLMFPGKEVTPLCFSTVGKGEDFDLLNGYVAENAPKHGFPALLFTPPEWSAETMQAKIKKGGFLGIKVYLNLAPDYIPGPEIRIFDFLPHHQLESLNKHKQIVMLHIPRDARLKDPVNLAQMMEIEHTYPDIKLIIAHVGRAYCPEDLGNAFEVLKDTKKMMFDFCANTCSVVFEELLKTVGPKRVMFGSDLPILRMRMKRICEKGKYINVVPRGLYGDVSIDSHMREVDSPEADSLTFFMYEELRAFKKAAQAAKLSKADLEDVFYNNAKAMIEAARAGR
jgi:predicted TIM-barrel fold metal-dependent hydrolase